MAIDEDKLLELMTGVYDMRFGQWEEENPGMLPVGSQLECMEAAMKAAIGFLLPPNEQPISVAASDYDDFVAWLTRQAEMADAWAKKNTEHPDSFDSGHYQAQRQAFTDARLRFLATFKREEPATGHQKGIDTNDTLSPTQQPGDMTDVTEANENAANVILCTVSYNGGDSSWPDEFTEWYEPEKWLSMYRAVGSFLADKVAKLRAPEREAVTPMNVIRLDEDGQVDDVAISGDLFRMERMNDGDWWVCIYRGEKRAAFTLTASSPNKAILQEDDIGCHDDSDEQRRRGRDD